MLKSAVVGYGRIVRDEQGNVIDIILPEDESGGADEGEDVDEDEEEEEEEEERVVQAKTDVVRCKSPFILQTYPPLLFSLHLEISPCANGIWDMENGKNGSDDRVRTDIQPWKHWQRLQHLSNDTLPPLKRHGYTSWWRSTGTMWSLWLGTSN